MFSKPKNGWTEIHLEEFEGLGSYIQDIPKEVMEGCISALRENKPLELCFDEEGSAFHLMAEEKTHIVTEGDFGSEEYELQISKHKLVLEMYADMERYLTDWTTFSEEYAYFEDDEEEQKEKYFAERMAMLKRLLGEFAAELKKFT